MRVGVYVDGFNLYYGGREQFPPSSPGWKWLDIRALATSLAGWPGCHVDRVVYCTAMRNKAGDPSSLADQQTYLDALHGHASVDHVEFGMYVRRTKRGVLVDRSGNAVPPSPATQVLPGRTVTNADGTTGVLVSVEAFEEKGSDVNVAAHVLHDVYTARVDACIVVSNDSDLELPIRLARERVPVGTVNPSPKQLATRLRGSATDGVGSHWWRRLTPADFHGHQLPVQVGSCRRPAGW